ncbi:MAG TPA: methionyl-tRNA formyltransferase [Patescibacteria group bacterium]|nr:methionyl-tRNA formyltransferase [Patescibacteria group bacterium]
MTKMSNQVIFFGSGPVAAEALSDLLNHFSFEAVITKPGDSKNPNLVEALASHHGLKLFLAPNRAALDLLFDNNPFDSQLGILIDYGIIVSPKVINSFPQGIINSHFSLLPQWRGADPITFAILSGQSKTGVSLMLINPELDEGYLLAQKEYDIQPDLTTPELTQALISLSGELLCSVVPKYVAGAIKPYPQNSSLTPTYSRKITKDDGRIDWRKPAKQIEREIRAYIDWPKSYTLLGSHEVIITKAKIINSSGEPGTIDLSDKKHLVIYCSDEALEVLCLKPAGKPLMTAEAFLAGYRVSLS